MIMKRTIHDEGHTRKFLVVVDDTEECDRAITYATYVLQQQAGHW